MSLIQVKSRDKQIWINPNAVTNVDIVANQPDKCYVQLGDSEDSCQFVDMTPDDMALVVNNADARDRHAQVALLTSISGMAIDAHMIKHHLSQLYNLGCLALVIIALLLLFIGFRV